MNDDFSNTPLPPYYAVIFTNQLSEQNDGYDQMAGAMDKLSSEQPGCLGAESTRNEDGLGITVSYWDSEESMLNWKRNAKHLVAQKTGIKKWYDHYIVRIAKVEREYCGPDGRDL